MDDSRVLRMLLAAGVVLLVAGCDGKVRSEFVAGCMSQGAPEAKCVCVYDKLKDKYGVDGLKAMQRGETVLPGFAEASVVAAAQCSGIDPKVALNQLGLSSDSSSAASDAAPPQAEASSAPAPQDLALDERVIDDAIAISAGSNAGEEYRDARKVATGDLNGDGADDAAAVFTIEDGAQNTSTQFLAAFTRQGDGALKFASTRSVGGTGNVVDGISIEDGAIQLKTLTQGPDDADCCPSVVGKVEFLLHDGKLKLVE